MYWHHMYRYHKACSLIFESLLPISINLLPVDAVKEFDKRGQNACVVADQDLESGDLIQAERTVVTDKKQNQRGYTQVRSDPLPRGREVGRLHTEELSCRAYWVAMLPQLPVAGVSTSVKNGGTKKKATLSKTVNPP